MESYYEFKICTCRLHIRVKVSKGETLLASASFALLRYIVFLKYTIVLILFVV